MTPERERFVATQMVQKWMNEGYSPAEISLIWNGGSPTIKKGINGHGVAYDTGAYMRKVLAQLQ
jgi:hypothetical protein